LKESWRSLVCPCALNPSCSLHFPPYGPILNGLKFLILSRREASKLRRHSHGSRGEKLGSRLCLGRGDSGSVQWEGASCPHRAFVPSLNRHLPSSPGDKASHHVSFLTSRFPLIFSSHFLITRALCSSRGCGTHSQGSQMWNNHVPLAFCGIVILQFL
jgi:hypothetical protein